MSGDKHQTRSERHSAGVRKHRVHALKHLVAAQGYDVPAEDLAARIIRDAVAGGAPARHR